MREKKMFVAGDRHGAVRPAEGEARQGVPAVGGGEGGGSGRRHETRRPGAGGSRAGHALARDTDVIVNIAATTNFYERYVQGRT